MIELERKIRKKIILEESGAIGYDLNLLEVSPENGQINGVNNLLSNTITIYVSPNFEIDEVGKKYLKTENKKEALEIIVSNLVRHEIGHWEYPGESGRGCPFDWFGAEEIYNGVRKGLGKKDEEIVCYIANMFMDIVDNTNVDYSLKEKGKEYKVVWLYYDQGKFHKKFTPLYDWFVRIQEDLWMNNEDKKILEDFHNKHELIDNKIEKLKEKFFEELKLKKGDHNLEKLIDRNNWERQAEIFAKLASEFLEYGYPRESLIGGEKIGKKSKLEEKIEDPNFRRKVVKRRWEKGKKMPSYLKANEALKYFYQELAKEIPIYAEGFTQNLTFPTVGYGKIESEVITRKIGINEEGELTFYKPKHWWEMQIPVKRSINGIPNLYLILDSSGSMRDEVGRRVPNANWSNKSKYHFVLLSFYGILNYLERMQIFPNKIAVTSFSDTSRTAIANYENLKEIEKILFSPEFQTTCIDLQQVKSTAKELGKCVIIMLSDGEIYNWEDVSEGMKEIMKENYSAFISIKSRSEPFYDLRKVAKMFYVEREEDLSKIMIDFVSETYRGLI